MRTILTIILTTFVLCVNAKNDFNTDSINLKNELNEQKIQVDYLFCLLKEEESKNEELNGLLQKINDEEKYKFLKITFGLNPNDDFVKTDQNISVIKFAIARYLYHVYYKTTNIDELKKVTQILKNINITTTSNYDMLDIDFTDNPLKKTKLYKEHKNDYRQKRIKTFLKSIFKN
jgi:hypothetical protein